VSSKIHIVGSHRAKLGESPVWSDRDSTLYWVDIDGSTVQALPWGCDEPEVWQVPGRPSCIALTPEPNRFVIGMGAGVIEFHSLSGQWNELVAMESTEGVRMNDGRADAAGRLWMGSMDERSSDSPGFPAGHLFCIGLDGQVDVVMEGVATSNGLAFSPDQRTMYWTDTQDQVIWAFDYDVASGLATNRRVFFDCTPLPGKPDGACTDVDGCYWLACVYGWSVVRITPDGRVDRTIELPVEKPSMPAFAGPNLDTLVVTSISTGGRRPAAPGQSEAGALLAVDVGVAGVAEPMCGVSL
jgi:L-arabinonolactonase